MGRSSRISRSKTAVERSSATDERREPTKTLASSRKALDALLSPSERGPQKTHPQTRAGSLPMAPMRRRGVVERGPVRHCPATRDEETAPRGQARGFLSSLGEPERAPEAAQTEGRRGTHGTQGAIVSSSAPGRPSVYTPFALHG